MSRKDTTRSPDPESRSMLRWYPARWRTRYGDELAAMIEDDLEGRPPSLSFRWAIIRSGLNERVRDAGLLGDSKPPAERVRSGALIVLCAFALFIISGVAFGKVSEHWDEAIHRGSRHAPAVFFNSLTGMAVACGGAVVLAAVLLLPTFASFLRTGGWPAIRRKVWRAVFVSLVTAATGAGLVVRAHQLTSYQRNHGFGWYQVLFVLVGALIAASVLAWTGAAVATTQRLAIESARLKILGLLAIGVALSMPVMTAAAAAWWGAMATAAPWFLAGTPTGSSPSPLIANLFAVLIVMMLASGIGGFGVIRLLRSWHEMQKA
jgi:hypothetical protein